MPSEDKGAPKTGDHASVPGAALARPSCREVMRVYGGWPATRLYCVWTRNRLKSDFDIDHCFPFAAWPCNDLWNLLPSAPAVNRSKGDRLPAAEALERSRSWILEWWDLAYRRDIVLRNQFEDEAQSALPAAVFGLEESVTPEDVFEGLMVQQMVLKRDQQLAVWRPSRP